MAETFVAEELKTGIMKTICQNVEEAKIGG